MSIAKAQVDGAIYELITYDEFKRNPSIYDNRTAVRGDDGYVYPIRNKTDIRPGMYPSDCIDIFKQPDMSESSKYSANNIIDFSKPENLTDLIKEQNKLSGMERVILTTIDNVFVPDIGPNDTPETKALKQAIIDKHIDLDKYEYRFGPNYNNDKRLLRKSSITLSKMKTIFEALDMKATLTIEDANPDVPNPIGHKITAILNGPEASCSIEEDGEGE